MLYAGRCLNFTFLPVASNDNDDLLAFAAPSLDLSIIREIKNDMRLQNAATGMLLSSAKDRKFFEEVIAAEKYILLRYFTINAPEATLRHLKRLILDRYLFPKSRRKRKKPEKPE